MVDDVTLFNELFTEYWPDKTWDFDVGNVAGLRELVDKSNELATKAARAAIFLTSEIFKIAEPAERGALVDPLYNSLATSSGFENAQHSLDSRYSDLQDGVYNLRGTSDSEGDDANATLIWECTWPAQYDATLCMLKAYILDTEDCACLKEFANGSQNDSNYAVYGSIFGSNCSTAHDSACFSNATYVDGDSEHIWRAPTSTQECVNERIARLSNNETTLNRLAMYAKRSVFLAFNFVSFCSALHENHDRVIRESVGIVRSIADGFVLSLKRIDSSSWPLLVKPFTAKTLTSAALKFPNVDADQTYAITARDIVSELKNTWYSHDYSAVVYYAYTGRPNSDVVFFNGSEEDSFHVASEMIKAFIKRYTSDDDVRVGEQWKSIEVDSTTLADLFADDETSTSMAQRFHRAKLDAKLFDGGGFRAAAVVPCAYRFVWYELAWQYFHAYGTTSEYVLTYSGQNAYKPCGAVVLFP